MLMKAVMFLKGEGKWVKRKGKGSWRCLGLNVESTQRVNRIIYCLSSLRGNQCMSFLKRILTCGWNEHDDTPIVGLPRFCLNKKSRFGGATKPKVKSIQSTMQSIQAESLCNPCPETINQKYHLPSLSFLTCRHAQVN